MRLIIDTDAGVDDAQALMMAFAQPGVTVEAITTVTGNVHVDKVIPNVFTVMDVMGRDTPVYRGADSPLLPGFWEPEVRVHGDDGLGNYQKRPATTRAVCPEPAAAALVRLANDAPGAYTLVALGPLTNIALACRLDPSFPLNIKQFVFMGGTVSAMGNTRHIAAEFNFFCDPEAALITLDAFPDTTMLSWEATVANPFTWEQYDALAALDTPAAHFMKDITLNTVMFLRKLPVAVGYLLPDPLAMAVALKPEIVQASDHQYVTVETQGRLARGQSVIDHNGMLRRDPNVHIVTRVNIDAVIGLYRQMLRNG